MAEQEKYLDSLLDSLLATYSDAEPRPGFDTRLLSVLRAQQRSVTLAWFWTAAAAAALTAAICAFYFSRLVALPAPPGIAVAGPPSLAPDKVTASAGSVPRNVHRRQQIARPQPQVSTAVVGPRLEVFPTPTPLSDQERLLMRYLASTPRAEVASHAHEDEPTEGVDLSKPQTQRLNGIESFSTQ